ncbi:hypothetical protein ABIA35_009203 [Catenulispora sp. MAP12-49]
MTARVLVVVAHPDDEVLGIDRGIKRCRQYCRVRGRMASVAI